MLGGCFLRNFENINLNMNQRLKYIIILAVCIILGNQLIHLYYLYKEETTQYIYRQNNMITGAVYEFNMQSTNTAKGDLVSYDASERQLVYYIDKKIISFQLNLKADVQQINEQKAYDIRDPQVWTLKNLYLHLQAKQDSMHLQDRSIQFVIQDSTGKIKDSYPTSLETLSFRPKYQTPLGFISGDTLYAEYNYPYVKLIQSTLWQLILTIIISALLITLIINLYQTIRDEKKSGEYRELFISNLVHDLKRPIEDVIKVLYLLRDLSPEEQTLFLKQGRAKLDNILQSINRMLLQSTDAHGLRLNIKDINLQVMLETLQQKDHWSANKLFDIQIDFQSDDPMITGDRHFLLAVFQNFIDNALKYSGDQVTIHITCTEPDVRHVQIKIEDNGFGISSKNLQHVFERFHRGDYQENKEIKGHGQGLHYARTVILAHGGTIDIESEEGKGTAILVNLPRRANVKNKYKH